jgi:hypothetical protein
MPGGQYFLSPDGHRVVTLEQALAESATAEQERRVTDWQLRIPYRSREDPLTSVRQLVLDEIVGRRGAADRRRVRRAARGVLGVGRPRTPDAVAVVLRRVLRDAPRRVDGARLAPTSTSRRYRSRCRSGCTGAARTSRSRTRSASSRSRRPPVTRCCPLPERERPVFLAKTDAAFATVPDARRTHVQDSAPASNA